MTSDNKAQQRRYVSANLCMADALEENPVQQRLSPSKNPSQFITYTYTLLIES